MPELMGVSGGIYAYNLYAYCENDPVMYKDETGKGLILTCILIGAAIGIAVGAIGGSHWANHKKI